MTPPRTRFLRRGDRIELLRCESYGPTPRPHPGDRGTVQSVSADGDARVNWDSGVRASVNPDAGDRFRFLETLPPRGLSAAPFLPPPARLLAVTAEG